MDYSEFLVEAQRLARTGFLLSENGDGEPLAYWHGMNFVMVNQS